MIINSNYFIFIDILVALLFLSMIVIGYMKGLLYELISILYTVGSLFLAWFVSPVLANLYPFIDIEKIYPESALLVNVLNLNPLINTIVYFVLVFLILKVLHVIVSIITKGFNKIPVIGMINKLLGACLGFINGLLITMAISMLFSLPLFQNGQEIQENTILKYTNSFTNTALTAFIENVDLSNIQKYFDNFDIEESREDFKKLISKYE